MASVLEPTFLADQRLTPGTYASAGRSPNLSIQEQGNPVLLQMICGSRNYAKVAKALALFLGRDHVLKPLEGAQRDGLLIAATGPTEFWIVASDHRTMAAISDLANIVDQTASLFDHSDGRIVFRLSGQNTIEVLAKGSAFDLRRQCVFPIGATHTAIEQVPALILWCDNPYYHDIVIPRSYRASFVAWLLKASSEYGYVIEEHKTDLSCLQHDR